jgi:hypothetical protein
MSTSATTDIPAAATDVRVTDTTLIVQLADGRTVSVPLEWYPRLAEASRAERRRWELIGPGVGIHWPAVDEDISIEGLLRGLRSGESAASLNRWRASRRRPANTRLQPAKARKRGTRKATTRPRLRG